MSESPTMSDLPGKSRRAIAYAANIARRIATNVAMRQMPIELMSARTKSSLLKICSYDAHVIDRGQKFPSLRLPESLRDNETIHRTGMNA